MATRIAQTLIAILTAVAVWVILTFSTGCSAQRVKTLGYKAEEIRSHELDICVRTELAGGATVEICTDEQWACSELAWRLRKRGQSVFIRDKRLRVNAVSLCHKVSR